MNRYYLISDQLPKREISEEEVDEIMSRTDSAKKPVLKKVSEESSVIETPYCVQTEIKYELSYE